MHFTQVWSLMIRARHAAIFPKMQTICLHSGCSSGTAEYHSHPQPQYHLREARTEAESNQNRKPIHSQELFARTHVKVVTAVGQAILFWKGRKTNTRWHEQTEGECAGRKRWHGRQGGDMDQSLKWKGRHVVGFFINGCMRGCRYDNLPCSHWWKSWRHGSLSVAVMEGVSTWLMKWWLGISVTSKIHQNSVQMFSYS